MTFDELKKNRDAWREIAIRLGGFRQPCIKTCVDMDPAGNTYELRPAPEVVELWNTVIPDLDVERDFDIVECPVEYFCSLTEEAFSRCVRE